MGWGPCCARMLTECGVDTLRQTSIYVTMNSDCSEFRNGRIDRTPSPSSSSILLSLVSLDQGQGQRLRGLMLTDAAAEWCTALLRVASRCTTLHQGAQGVWVGSLWKAPTPAHCCINFWGSRLPSFGRVGERGGGLRGDKSVWKCAVWVLEDLHVTQSALFCHSLCLTGRCFSYNN